MADKWVGKIAVVTGASAGMGSEIFKELAKNGINVIGLARRPEKVDEVIKKMGSTKGRGYAYKCDVANANSVKEAFKWIESKFGYVNILVNNAGVLQKTTILGESEDSLKSINETFDINVRGVALCSREAYRLMKKSNDYGLIININSTLGHAVPFFGLPLSVYCASKYAITALTESIRQELVIEDNKKVRITSLSPGYVETDIIYAGGFATHGGENLFAGMPALKGEDIANSVMFILSTPYNVNISELTIKPVGEKN